MDAATLIRLTRTKRGLTQGQLAALAGTSQPAISAYEQGSRDPGVETLRKIVAATGERLSVGTTTAVGDLEPLRTPQEHGEALVDVLLLADAIPLRTPPSKVLVAPRIDSSRTTVR